MNESMIQSASQSFGTEEGRGTERLVSAHRIDSVIGALRIVAV